MEYKKKSLLSHYISYETLCFHREVEWFNNNTINNIHYNLSSYRYFSHRNTDNGLHFSLILFLIICSFWLLHCCPIKVDFYLTAIFYFTWSTTAKTFIYFLEIKKKRKIIENSNAGYVLVSNPHFFADWIFILLRSLFKLRLLLIQIIYLFFSSLNNLYRFHFAFLFCY